MTIQIEMDPVSEQVTENEEKAHKKWQEIMLSVTGRG